MGTANIFKLVMAATILFGGATASDAQATNTASASANIVEPVGIVKNVDMNFGNASVATGAGGGIILTPSGARTTSGSGVTLPATTGTVAAAEFTVTGAPGYSFAITLPSSAVISGPGASSMSVNGFTSSPSGTGTLSTSGTQYLKVGATLTIAAAQAPGTYTNATAIPVTVNYN